MTQSGPPARPPRRSRIPVVVGSLCAVAALVVLGPVALAVALLRSSSDAHGPTAAAQILIALILVGLVAAAGLAGWGAARLAMRLLGRA